MTASITTLLRQSYIRTSLDTNIKLFTSIFLSFRQLDEPSLILDAKACAEKPAKTTECTAPILAQASMVATAIGDTGRYTATLCPFVTPV